MQRYYYYCCLSVLVPCVRYSVQHDSSICCAHYIYMIMIIMIVANDNPNTNRQPAIIYNPSHSYKLSVCVA